MNDWLELHDSEISATDLMATIEQRVSQRQAEQGPVTHHFPAFGFVATMPQPPAERPYSETLYHHLRLLNEMTPADTTPLLAASPATRLPLIGPLWQMIRGSAHDLVLFYVNRVVARDSKRNNHLLSVLNELTHLVEEQQAEIEQLRHDLESAGSQKDKMSS